MEFINEWYQLIVIVFLGLILFTLLAVVAHIQNTSYAVGMLNQRLILNGVKIQQDHRNKVQEVNVVNRVPVDVKSNVGVEIKGIADYAGTMKVKIEPPVQVTNYAGPLDVKVGSVQVDNVVRTTPYKEDIF